MTAIRWQSRFGGEAGTAALVFLIGAIYLSVRAISFGGEPFFERAAGAAVCYSLFIGLILRREWSRWLAAFACLIVATYAIQTIMSDGFSMYPTATLLACLFGTWHFWRMELSPLNQVEMAKAADDRPATSLVLLRGEPVSLETEVLAAAASAAWGIDLSTGDEGEEDTETFVTGRSPHIIVQTGEWLVAIHSVSTPYFDDRQEVADACGEAPLAEAVREHRAWLSVDLLRRPEKSTEAEAYRRIGRLVAELVDPQSLAVLCPATGRARPLDSEALEVLSGPDPLAVFRPVDFPPVVRVDEDDPALVATVVEARDHWPQFLLAFDTRTLDQTFYVKATFRERGETEFMWLTVTALEHDFIYGVLDSEPLYMKAVRQGDRVRVELHDVSDWVYTQDGQMHGGFSFKVLGRG